MSVGFFTADFPSQYYKTIVQLRLEYIDLVVGQLDGHCVFLRLKKWVSEWCARSLPVFKWPTNTSL